MASVEPSWRRSSAPVVFRESMSGLAYLGVVLVLSAVVLLNVKPGKKKAG